MNCEGCDKKLHPLESYQHYDGFQTILVCDECFKILNDGKSLEDLVKGLK